MEQLTGCPSIDKLWLKYYSDEAVQAAENPVMCSLYDYIYSVNKDSSHIAIEYFGAKINYIEMFNRIDKLAICFKNFGITKGDFVTICLPNIPEYIYSVYALNKIGAIVNLIDPRTNSERILEQTNEVHSKLLIVIEDICNTRITDIANKLLAKKIIVVSASESAKSIVVKLKYIKKYDCSTSEKYILYNDFINTYIDNIKIESVYSENSAAAIVYTSGTTGISKGVILSNEGIISAARQLCITLISEGTKFLAIIPFSFAYGLVDGMHTALSNKMTLTLIPKYKPNDFTRLILKYKPNVVIAVPKFWEDLAHNLYKKNISLSYLLYPISGGDKISNFSVEFINQCLKKHNSSSKLLIGYGATEFGAAVSLTTPNGPYEVGSVGELMPIGNIKIIDRNTEQELSYGLAGEICIRTQSMMIGYFQNENEMQHIIYTDNEGNRFYRTGDKGYISDDGCLYIVDRYKRVMMRPDGHTVHATSIENILMSTGKIRNCAVVGLRINDRAGVIPTAYIVPEENCDINGLIQYLDQFSLKKLPDRDRAIAYVAVEKIPYTQNGKIDYEFLEDKEISEVNAIITDYTFLKK